MLGSNVLASPSVSFGRSRGALRSVLMDCAGDEDAVGDYLEGAQVTATLLYSSQMQRFPELRFSATLGQEPEVEISIV
jgi:hypothetical protein